MSISLKLLAAIVAPLLIQVCFFAWYANLLAQSENLSTAEARSSTIVAHINWLSTQLSLKCVAAVQFAVTGDDEFMDMVNQCRKQVTAEIKEIKTLYGSNPADQENVQEMSDVATSLATVCDNVLASKEADHDISSLQCPTVKARWKDFLKARDTLLAEENARHDLLMSKLPQSRQKLEQMLSFGIGINVVLAIILMRFLGAGIVSRIKQLTTNSKLLAEGKPLTGAHDKGNDEITQLDQAFRKMAGDLQQAMEREAIHARTDHLSGLNNRRAFNETMEHIVSLSARTKQEFSLLICDIDHFKSINDRFGHGVGDEAIKAVAAAILSVVRQSDFPARWGGEEFIVGMANTDATGALSLAERVRNAVANIELQTEAGIIQFTTSIGVAVLDEKHESTENCIQRADAALYKAKTGGRNRVEVAELEGTMRLARMLPPA